MPRLLRLDRMEIIGFKSFYGRTLFEFPEGITAVVGPNGCGKSNIGDAISWVLGEQKASSLRSDRMEDVIFNGSDAKRPLGMAEVSLHFKNLGADGNGHAGPAGNGHGAGGPEGAPAGAGLAPPPAVEITPSGADLEVPIAQVGEIAPPSPDPDTPGARFFLEEIPEDVVVTRRLYRSGESEYALNGRRCRLKDVQDLMARTRVGTRLYTTIEQGKIDQILSSKPKERRTLLEEAAGILGYRIKRRHAEMKLEAAGANLLRLSDIISEVEKQIGSLKRQAAKARRYRRLLEILRARRGEMARRRLAESDAERAATLAAIGRLRERESEAAASLGRAEADVEALRLRLEEDEEASRSRREEMHALDMAIDRLQARLRAADEQGRDLEERDALAGREIEALAARVAAQEARRAALRSTEAAEGLRAADAEAELRAAESRRDAQARAIDEREAFLEDARAGLLRELDRAAAGERARAALEEQARAAGATLLRVEKEASEARAALRRLAERVARLEAGAAETRAARARCDADRERLAAEERGAAERVLALERRAEELKGRAAALSERFQEMRRTERQRAGYGEGVIEILAGAAGFAPRGTVGERLDVPRGLERPVAAALEGILDAVVVPGPDEAARGIAYLRSRSRGRVAFVTGDGKTDAPAPRLPAVLEGRPGVVGLLCERVGGPGAGVAPARRLERAVLVETLEAALACSDLCPGFSFVTSEGDIVREDGVVTGGDGRALPHGVLALRADMDDLASRLAETEREREAAEAALPDARSGLDACRERLAGAQAALQACDKALLEIELKIVQDRGELQKSEATLPLLEAERDRLARTAQDGAAEQERHRADSAAAAASRVEREEAIRAASDALVGLRGEHEAAQNDAASARAAVAAGVARASALGREMQAVVEGLLELQAEAARRSSERQEFGQRLSDLREQAAASGRELEASLIARAGAAAREEAAAAGLAYDRGLVHAREQAAKEARTALEARRRELQDRELQLARLEADLEHLERTCRDDLQTTLEALRATPPPTAAARTVQEDESELESIRADLDGMGPVNLMAIEQHGELEERFNFLLAQKTDLEGSIASLRETIRKINRQSRERLLAAFKAIQEGFQECFATLFGGGQAELRLVEEDDILEAGIEIAARPPGKRLQSMALLSGGEKALTAVALLFSLFRYRPSPFCVLDEVDAPLDEANVERFTRLLQKLSEETQFIVITHNRKSMEAADLLYGVTMEEPGVSKVLPLRFE